MKAARRYVGWVALASYLYVGAVTYLTVLPGADWRWPPDFHLRGYDLAIMTQFVGALSDEARTAYAGLLLRWDRVFIISFVLWVGLMGWQGGWMRYAVAGLAVLYGAVDLAENAAIYQFVFVLSLDEATVQAASQLTMAKFASLYLCGLVLLVHWRRLPLD